MTDVLKPNTRLVFEVATAHFMGGAEFRAKLLELIGRLPENLIPSRCRSSRNSKKSAFSLKSPVALESLLPGSNLFEGDVSLYKPKSPLELGIMWSCGDKQWFDSLGKKPFNKAFIVFENASRAVGDCLLFEFLSNLWLHLCDVADAAYGYCYLEDTTTGSQPRGEGYCLPRLHWQTYFGPEYSTVLSIGSIAKYVGTKKVGRGNLFSAPAPPETWMHSNPEEQKLIEKLGASFFWYEGDSWRKPQGSYQMPDFDWSEVIGCGENKKC